MIDYLPKKTSVITWLIILLCCCLNNAFGQSLEVVPYRLIPSHDQYCQISIELIEPTLFLTIPDVHRQEIHEILIERVVFEETNPFAHNEPFKIDDNVYQLIKLPNTGEAWSSRRWSTIE